jgi:hypothetical protein
LSVVIFSAIFYGLCFLSALLMTISSSPFIPQFGYRNMFVFWFCLIVIMINILEIVLGKKSKEKARSDFGTPINDTDQFQNQLIQCVYSLPPVFSIPFEFFWRILQISLKYGPVFSLINIQKDWDSICSNVDNFCPKNEEHNAIIIGIYNRFAQSALLGSGIDLLIDSFNEIGEKYRVYFVKNRKEFFSIVNSSTTSKIWIFSHGDRGGIKFPYRYCSYRDLVKRMSPESLKKEAVYQFHCNPGNDPSLAELLSVKKGFVNHRINDSSGIQEYIRIILEKDRLNELIILE